MPDRYAPGDRVRARHADPPHHTRLPRYARGARGEVVAASGHHPLADDRAQGLDVQAQTVYQVRFASSRLFGAGDHDLVIELWESYLEPDPDDSAGA
ncbi:SH3-like domain-containing protein [Pseudonocardia nematodicida]|uniref:SH3-like domain-containing protein n=1 Tax=Pseudonocardia nematodicida TaxID=1206997 RepID=A0ABV1KHJ5_9PSEU